MKELKRDVEIIYWKVYHRNVFAGNAFTAHVHIVLNHGKTTIGYILSIPRRGEHFSIDVCEGFVHTKIFQGRKIFQGHFLSLGCPQATEFVQHMPITSSRKPCYADLRHSMTWAEEDILLEHLEAYIRRTIRRYPETLKKNYLWKCDE